MMYFDWEMWERAIEEFRKFQRWLEKHDWFFRKLYRVHVKPPETCDGYGNVVCHPY